MTSEPVLLVTFTVPGVLVLPKALDRLSLLGETETPLSPVPVKRRRLRRDGKAVVDVKSTVERPFDIPGGPLLTWFRADLVKYSRESNAER